MLFACAVPALAQPQPSGALEAGSEAAQTPVTTDNSSHTSIHAHDGGRIVATNTQVNNPATGSSGSPLFGVGAIKGGSVTFAGGSVITSGASGYALFASSGTVDAAGAEQALLAITTTGERGFGAYANADTVGGGTINLTNASITTSGNNAYGIFAARQSGATAQGIAVVNATNVNIETTGATANGIYAKAGSSVTTSNVNVTVSGAGASGALVQSYDTGSSGITDAPAVLAMSGGSLNVTRNDAFSLAVADGGTFSATGTTLTSSTNAAGAQTSANIGVVFSTAGRTADITLGQGSIATQNAGILMGVQRGGAGTDGIVNLTLAGSTTAGNIIDTGPAGMTGYTNVTISNGGVHTGGFQNVNHLTLDNGTVVSNGLVGFSAVTLAAGGGTFDTSLSGNLTIASAIDGSGGLTKQGAGILTLTGPLSYTGDTIVLGGNVVVGSTLPSGTDLGVSGGTITFGTDQNVASLSGTGGTVDLGANTLSVSQASNTTFAGSLAGTGSFEKTGSGTLNLTGNNTFSGDTAVNGGTLAVNGSLANSVVSVANGGTIGGNGTIGGLVVGASGAAGPGNSIGTLNVAGNVLFNPGSFYRVEVNAAGQSDRINATGTATLNGGTVQVQAQPGLYDMRTNYTILTAQGGITGQFAGVTSNYAFLDPSLSYTVNSVQLRLDRNNTPFSSVGATGNQASTGAGVQSLGFGNPVYNAVVQLDAPTARGAFDQLSGEIHASVRSTLLDDSRLVRDGVLSRLRQDAGPRQVDVTAAVPGRRGGAPVYAAPQYGLWGQGFGSWGRVDASANAAKVDRSTGGFLLGTDGEIGNGTRLGLAGGYSSTTVDANSRLSSAHIDSYHATIYGGTSLGPIGLRLGGSYTWNDIETARTVAFPGFADVLAADYRARTAQIFGEAGYKFAFQGATLEPFAGLAYVNLDTDGFRENGGAAALNGRGDSESVTYTTLGLHASTIVALNATTDLTLKGTLGWRHAFDEVRPTALLGFGTGLPFQVSGAPVARDALLVEGEVGTRLYENVSVGIGYTGQLASEVQDHGVKGKFLLTF